jgi:uncharacterized membrane protein YdbT with pleckstrin-like domain
MLIIELFNNMIFCFILGYIAYFTFTCIRSNEKSIKALIFKPIVAGIVACVISYICITYILSSEYRIDEDDVQVFVNEPSIKYVPKRHVVTDIYTDMPNF